MRRTLPLTALVLTGAQASAQEPNLAHRIDQLESQISMLEHQESEAWLSVERAAAVRGLVAEVLADADTRASLLGDEATAGYDDGFFVASADGAFRLEVGGQVQPRFVWNRRTKRDKSDSRYGFEMRRAKIKLDGQLDGGNIGFTVGAAAARRGGGVRLQSFNIRFRLTDELRLLVGRARPPLLREESVSSKRQLAAERSLVVKTFRQTRTLGVTIRHQGEHLRLSAGLMDASPVAFVDDIWRASARADWLASGEWDALEDFTSFVDDEPAMAFGAGVLFQNNDLSDPARNDSRLLRWSVDGTFEFAGANLFASLIGNRVEEETRPTLTQWGAVVQGGYFLNETWEAFARYEWGDADGEAPGLSVITVGVNAFLDEHRLKLTLDVGYGLNEVDDFWSSSGAGWLSDRSGEDGQTVTRFQAQLLF